MCDSMCDFGTLLRLHTQRILYWSGWRAGNENRTRIASLEGWSFTIKLCPQDNERGKMLPWSWQIASRFLPPEQCRIKSCDSAGSFGEIHRIAAAMTNAWTYSDSSCL